MTEQEAKTKWCPFARGVNDSGGNRVAYGSADDGPVEDDYTLDAAMKFPCIGSACMAWRESPGSDWASQFKAYFDSECWIEAIKLHRNSTGSTLKDAKDFVDDIREGRRSMPARESNGFCGLAGKP